MNPDVHLLLIKDVYLMFSIIGLSIIAAAISVILWFTFKPLSLLKRIYTLVTSTVNEIIYFFIEAVSTIKWLDKFFKEP